MNEQNSFFTSRHNTLIGIGLACVMGVLAYFGLFYQQKAVAQDYPVQGFDVFIIKVILTGKNITGKIPIRLFKSD